MEPERCLLEQVEQAVVGPMGVVDPDRERALGRKQRDEPAPRPLQLVLGESLAGSSVPLIATASDPATARRVVGVQLRQQLPQRFLDLVDRGVI